jgi:hypothetical protein
MIEPLMLDTKPDSLVRRRSEDFNQLVQIIQRLPQEEREAIHTALVSLPATIDMERIKGEYYNRLKEIFKQNMSLQKAIQYVGIQQTGFRFEVWVVVQAEWRKDAVYALVGLIDDFLEAYGYETVSRFFCPEYHGDCFPDNFQGNFHVTIYDKRVFRE